MVATVRACQRNRFADLNCFGTTNGRFRYTIPCQDIAGHEAGEQKGQQHHPGHPLFLFKEISQNFLLLSFRIISSLCSALRRTPSTFSSVSSLPPSAFARLLAAKMLLPAPVLSVTPRWLLHWLSPAHMLLAAAMRCPSASPALRRCGRIPPSLPRSN